MTPGNKYYLFLGQFRKGDSHKEDYSNYSKLVRTRKRRLRHQQKGMDGKLYHSPGQDLESCI